MILDVPAVVFKTPKKLPRKHKGGDKDGQPTGELMFIHSIIIEGEQVDLFADTDYTVGLNGSRDKLDKGQGVEVVASLDLSVYRGKLSPRLEGLAEPDKHAPKGSTPAAA